MGHECLVLSGSMPAFPVLRRDLARAFLLLASLLHTWVLLACSREDVFNRTPLLWTHFSSILLCENLLFSLYHFLSGLSLVNRLMITKSAYSTSLWWQFLIASLMGDGCSTFWLCLWGVFWQEETPKGSDIPTGLIPWWFCKMMALH